MPPNPQAVLAAIVIMFLSLVGGFSFGHHYATMSFEADSAKSKEATIKLIKAEADRADTLAKRLHEAQSAIHIKTVEVIKYVPKVTDGKPCLTAGAVGLLQPGSNQGLRSPPGEPPAKDATPVASDTDVAYWIAGANEWYETCSARLTALIEFTDKVAPSALP